jgi:hypothetical protein
MTSRYPMLLPVLALASLIAGVAVDARQQEPAKPYVPPRTPDGQPDIQGIYNPVGTFYNIEDLEYQSLYQNFKPNPSLSGKSLIIDPPDGKIPYQAWAAEKRKPIYQLHGDPTPEYVDPNAQCWPQGVPRHMNNREFEIFQPRGHVVIFNMAHHSYRVIPVDGSPHIPENVKLWQGDSRGRWEGNALVVDVTNNNDQTWFDVMASFHSDAMRITERMTPVGPDRIEYRAVITDPRVYTRPWTFAIYFNRAKDYGSEIYEEACVEVNDRNMELLKRPGRN